MFARISIKSARSNPNQRAVKNASKWGIPGCTCGYASPADTLAAAIPQKNKHATKHFHAIKHPVVRSFEPGENWMWCYIDELMFEED